MQTINCWIIGGSRRVALRQTDFDQLTLTNLATMPVPNTGVTWPFWKWKNRWNLPKYWLYATSITNSLQYEVRNAGDRVLYIFPKNSIYKLKDLLALDSIELQFGQGYAAQDLEFE